MEKMRLNRPYLESLSTGELTGVAIEQGIDVPGGLERMFIIEELLELAEEDESDEGTAGDSLEGRAPKGEGGGEFRSLVQTGVSSLLPRQYNITYLDVLIRDPLWVFAFWEIKAADRDFWERSEDFGGYFLKVSPVDSAGALFPPEQFHGSALPLRAPFKEGSFRVFVGLNDSSWYLGFPPLENRPGDDLPSRFQVDLCCLLGDGEEAVARAKPFKLPALLPAQGNWTGQSRLRVLSGLDDIPVLRNADRLSRSQGQAHR
jgi:hypothetical protein